MALTPERVEQRLRERFPNVAFERQQGEAVRDFTLFVPADALVEVCTFLRDDAELAFVLLPWMGAADYLPRVPRFECIYNLLSLANELRFTLKVLVTEEQPRVPSIVGVWPTANWHEREAYDFYGITFTGHPDLTRILLPRTGWAGRCARIRRSVTRKWRSRTTRRVAASPRRASRNSHPRRSATVRSETMTINMGPQHPSTHGVLRVALELDGENVVACKPIIGYLHTGMEKQAEYKTYTQSIPQTDRMDYISPMSNNLALCLSAEKLLGVTVPERVQAIRVLLTELTRISSHCVWLGTHAIDIGALTVFWYCFREREKVLSIYDMVSGARMTSSYFRVGGLAMDLPAGFLDRCEKFIDEMPAHIDEYESLLTKNPIWIARTKGVAPLSAKDAIAWGVTGPTLRGSGVKWDLRKNQPYSGYETYDFEVPVGTVGDAYDRFQVRVAEMRQSVRIAKQALQRVRAMGESGEYRLRDFKYVLPPKEEVKTSMEALIHHFKIVAHGFFPPVGEAYHAVEAPKGELGFYLVSDGSSRPWRMKIRSPSFINLQALPVMVEGKLIADVIAAIGSIDIVLGEIDR
jgi:NADH dehydrogenase I D subunit